MYTCDLNENRIRSTENAMFSFHEALKKSISHVGLSSNSKILNICIFGVLKLMSLIHIPVIYKFSNNFINLVYGYESENFSNANSEPSTSNFRETKSIPLYSHSNKKYYEVVIIGSGPGAASAFLELPKNKSVLLIEKGQAPTVPKTKQHTLEQIALEISNSGKEFIIGKHLPQFAQASIFGGGSQINSGLYHDTPVWMANEFMDYVGIANTEFIACQSKIRSTMRVSLQYQEETDSIIATGAKSLGLEFKNVERWRRYYSKKYFDFDHFGMIESVWLPALNDSSCNLEILLNTKVKHINHFDNYVKIITSNGLEIKAGKLIISGGSIDTPYLLAKNKLISWNNIKFQWHPMLRLICTTSQEKLGFYDIDSFQAWTNNLELKFGSGVSTPGLLSSILGYKIAPSEAKKLRSYYVSFVSSGNGGLVPNSRMPWYLFSKSDYKKIDNGIGWLSKIISSAGANMVQNVESSKKKISTVHIFGSLPYNSDIFSPGTNRLKFFKNILVADGSLLPSGPGVNPQGSLMAITALLTRRSLS